MAANISIQGNRAETGATQINNVNLTTTLTNVDIDRAWLRALRCPDPTAVKARIKEKDKLLYESIRWIHNDPYYIAWHDGHAVDFLWIKGGAGKGKTMMSLGLIDLLQEAPNTPAITTYFFCQHEDSELNKIEAIIKGLMLRLIHQQDCVRECLRRRWDAENRRFDEDLSSWQALWKVFLEMLEHCKSERIYIVVDALDECEGEDMEKFLQLIVRTGQVRRSKVKWLLTSRPLDSAERELLGSSDQTLVSLELNSSHIAAAVKHYAASRADELNRRHGYGKQLCEDIKAALVQKAEDTFLWVSLVCGRLELVDRGKALDTIRESPPGLYPFYSRILHQASRGNAHTVKGCMRLIKTMLLVYRPLHVEEISSVMDLPGDNSDCDFDFDTIIERCTSLVRRRGSSIEFVHQSVPDYLRKDGDSILQAHTDYGHGEITLSCLRYLSRGLKVNLFNLTRPDATRDSIQAFRDKQKPTKLVKIGYAAAFWMLHLQRSASTSLVQHALKCHGEIPTFLQNKFLEWLECLSLLDDLPRAVEDLQSLKETLINYTLVSSLLNDATRILLRHYETIANWPLQVYNSAIVFTPEQSVLRERNLDKAPPWLRIFPKVERAWTSLIRTLTGHTAWVGSVAFSPDGRRIASGSYDGTVKLWDAATGEAQATLTLTGHTDLVRSVAFSPDGRRIASGSYDRTVKLWDAATGEAQATLTGHTAWVWSVAFSPDGRRIASGSYDRTVKLWDAATGEAQATLTGHTGSVRSVAFSPDGRRIASGSDDRTVKLWDAATGEAQATLTGRTGSVGSVAFSPDGRRIASGSYDGTVELWDAATGEAQATLTGHTASVGSVAFSPDGRRIASGSDDRTVKLWDAATGETQATLTGHTASVGSVAFSPDGRRIASGSDDGTVKLWDAATGETQATLTGHTDSVGSVAFSPDGRRIASGSDDRTVKLWDAATGEAQATLTGHTASVRSVAFSPDGRRIASGSYDRTVKLWDAATGEAQATLTGHTDWVRSVAFSPDGRRIASGSHDGTVKLWDAATGEAQATLTGHTGSVRSVAFSPDGRRIASGSYDGTVKLWDAATGEAQATLTGHTDSVGSVAFSPDGRRIASGSDDRTVKLWDAPNTLRSSRVLGITFRRPHKTKRCKTIPTNGVAHNLKFPITGNYVISSLGRIHLPGLQNACNTSLEDLKVRENWLCYGDVPIIRLSPDVSETCFDTTGDAIAIGLRDGRVLSLDVDRSNLHSLFKVGG